MSDVKKAREALYDLISEEALLSHAISNPKILIEAKSVIETMTGERKVLAEAIFDLASNNAVSYTHLTLPTNREV